MVHTLASIVNVTSPTSELELLTRPEALPTQNHEHNDRPNSMLAIAKLLETSHLLALPPEYAFF